MKRRRQVPPSRPQQDPTTGSPSGGPVFLAAGKLRRAHGIAGDMIMDVLTDFPERLRPGRTVYVGENHDVKRIASVRGHNKQLIIHIDGINAPEETAPFRNAILYVKASELPKLPEGEYYHHQLLGMSVVNEAGLLLGELVDILETGANDVYVVKTPDGKELLLPAVEEVILGVDLQRGEIRVQPPEWQ